MYLLLLTQGLEHEIGTKYQELCLRRTSEVGDIIQTDMKLKKGLSEWHTKHNRKPRTEQFNWITVMGIVKSRAWSTAVDYGSGQYDNLYNASLEGAATAYLNYDPIKHQGFKKYVERCCNNSIINDLRKVKRWNRETPLSSSPVERLTGGMGGDDEDLSDVTFETNVSDDNQGLGNAPMWIEPKRNPEEEYLHKEEVEVANVKVAAIVRNLNERELFILWNNIFNDEPMTVRDIAAEFKCDKSSIQRDINRMRKNMRLED